MTRAPNRAPVADEFGARPDDHVDQQRPGDPTLPRLGVLGWARWAWRLLTSMRTALLLLLLVAIAAVPGSLFPQRSSDPNGVVQYFDNNPEWAPTVDALGLFNVYTSPWFSGIYLLLFVSLIGCVIPRTRHHATAMLQPPPRTPSRLNRLPAHHTLSLEDERRSPAELADRARALLRRAGYRVATYPDAGGRVSVAAERGYLRETGNLLFHIALIGVLVAVAIGGGFRYQGQRVIVEGEGFVNARASYDTFTTGAWFSDESLPPFSVTLQDFAVEYVEDDPANLGFITDYTATVDVLEPTTDLATTAIVKVNEPLAVSGAQIYLLGNGYAPQITIRDPNGTIVLEERIPFLPQDGNLTSLGIIKVPDGLAEQVGAIGFFYPTQSVTASGAYTSIYPDLQNPVMTLNVFTGDLGLDDGTPRSVYKLDTSTMTQLSGGSTGVDSLELRPGETVQLPSGLGTVELGEVRRFAALDVAYDPTQRPVLISTVLALAGMALALFVPRRRIWFRFTSIGPGQELVECAGLARGDDPTLDAAVGDLLARFPRPDSAPTTTGRSGPQA
jgi:cytochrome c biogenesis protein